MSVLRNILEVLEQRTETPNKFTRFLGERVKEAREEAGMSQTELARIIYRRRPSLSDIENGKMMPDIGTVLLLAHSLEKPLDYFIYPAFRQKSQAEESLTPLEYTLLNEFKRLSVEKQRLAIEQIRTLADHFERE